MFRDRCGGLLRRLAQDCAARLHGGLVIHGVHRGLRRHEVKPDHGHQGKGVQGDEDVIHGVGSGLWAQYIPLWLIQQLSCQPICLNFSF